MILFKEDFGFFFFSFNKLLASLSYYLVGAVTEIWYPGTVAAYWSAEGEEESEFTGISVRKCPCLTRKQPVPLKGLLVRQANVLTC